MRLITAKIAPAVVGIGNFRTNKEHKPIRAVRSNEAGWIAVGVIRQTG